MSPVLKSIRAGVALLAAFVVLALAVALSIPDDTYRGWLVDAVSSSTGRELHVDGDFEIDAGTRIKVRATNVRFANAEWAKDPSMVEVGRLNAEIRLLPLLSGVIDVALDVDSPTLRLETDESGRGNWQMGDGKAPPDAEPGPDRSETAAPPEWAIAPTVRISNGYLRFFDAASGSTEELELTSFELGAPNSNLAITLDGLYKGKTVSLSGDLGDVQSIVAGDPVDIQLDAVLGEISLSGKGSWSSLLASAGPTVDILLAVDAPSTHAVEPFAGGGIPDLGKLGFAARLVGGDGAFAAEDVKFSIDGPDLTFAIEGRVGDLVQVQKVELEAEYSTDRFPAIVDAFGVELPGKAPQSLTARWKIHGGIDGLALEDLDARLVDGQVLVEFRGSAEDLITQRGIAMDLSLTAPSLADLSGLAGRSLPQSGAVEAKAHLASKDSTYEITGIDARIEGDDLSGGLKGSVGDLLALSDVNLDVDALIGSLSRFSDLAGTPMPETAPLKVTAEIVASEGVEGPTKISGNLDSDWLRGNVEATVADVRAAEGVDATLDLELQSLAVLSGVAGRALPAMGPIRASGKLASQGATYALTDLDIGIEDEALQAQVMGSVADVLAATGVSMALNAEIGSLSRFSALAGVELPETKPLSLKADLSADQGAQGPTRMSGKLQSDWLAGTLEATIDDLLAARGIAGDLNLKLQSLSDLSSIVGRELPAVGPIETTATVASAGESYALPKFTVIVEDQSVRANLSGSIGDLVTLRGIELALQGGVDSLSSLSQLAGTELPQTPAVNVQAKVSAAAGLEGPVKVSTDVSSGSTKASVQGVIGNLAKLQETQFEVALDAPSLDAFSPFAGAPLPKVGPVKLSTIVRGSAREIELLSLDLGLGSSDLQGDAKLILPAEGGKPNLTGIFRSRLLDAKEIADAGGQSGSSSASGTGAETPSGSGRMFPDDPLPFEALNLVDAFVELNAQRLVLPITTTESVRATLNLENGGLKLDALASVGGRPVELRLASDAGRQPPSAELVAQAEVVPLSEFLSSDAVLDGGDVYLSVDVTGAGRSVRDIMAGLDGYANVALRDTKLKSEAFARFGQDILSQINPLSADSGYSKIECSAVAFTVEDGIATTPRGLISMSDAATWSGQAEVNLKTEQINLTIQSKAREGLGIGAGMLASAVQVRGTLLEPTISLNPVGLATMGGKAALAVFTGGTSLLASGLLDRVTSKGELCKELVDLIIVREAAKGPAKTPGPRSVDGVRDGGAQ